jgi:hypothetical protein
MFLVTGHACVETGACSVEVRITRCCVIFRELVCKDYKIRMCHKHTEQINALWAQRRVSECVKQVVDMLTIVAKRGLTEKPTTRSVAFFKGL